MQPPRSSQTHALSSVLAVIHFAVHVSAKAEEVPVDWKEEFSKVRAGSADLIEDLRKLASDEDWPALMETTKFSDLAFRKS